MAFAVELFLREEDAGIIDHFWAWMNEHQFGTEMDGRPHVTLAVWDTFPMDEVAAWIGKTARETPPLPIHFASLGIFPNHPSVLFVAPIVTRTLIDVQARVVTGLPAPPETLWVNYQSGRWVPHCTLGMRLELAACLEAMAQAKTLPLPFDAVLDRLAVVEIPAVVNHLTVDLTG